MSFWKTPADTTPAFKIQVREGCRVVYGDMPLGDFLKLMKQANDNDLLHPDTARMLGATAVLGPKEGLRRIRDQETAAAMARARAQLGRYARRLDGDALRWLASGEQGLSTLAFFVLLADIPARQCGVEALELPMNAADFRRCRLLLEQVPSLRASLPVLASRVCDEEVATWAALAESWHDICAQMDHEVPSWREGLPSGRCAPGVDAMLACFHEVQTDHASLYSSRMSTLSLGLPRGGSSAPGRYRGRGNQFLPTRP